MGVCIVDILLSAIHSLLLWLVNTVPDDKNRFWRRRAPCSELAQRRFVALPSTSMSLPFEAEGEPTLFVLLFARACKGRWRKAQLKDI